MGYNLIKYFYEMGVFDLKKMIEQVDLKNITEKEFHSITSRDYQGVKKMAESK